MRLSALSLLFLLTSCATIVNRPTYKARISSNAANAKAVVYGTTYDLPAKVELTRSRDSLEVQLVTDSLTKDFSIAPKTVVTTIIANAATLGALSPLAIILDSRKNRNRTYGRNILLDIGNTSGIVNSREKPPYDPVMYKGRVNLVASLPYVNSFYLQHPAYGDRGSTGFLGLSVGAEYYYKNDRSLKLTAGAMMDFELPIPVPVDYDGPREAMSSFFVSLTDNRRLGRFTLGYGPSWTVNTLLQTNSRTWADEQDEDYYHREYITRSFGLSLTGHVRIVPRLYAGILYNPSIYSVTPVGGFNYSHTLSLDVQLRLGL